MPTSSIYTEDIIDFMKESGRPVTAPEIAASIGISRAGAYHWLTKTMNHIVHVVAIGANDAQAWQLIDPNTDSKNPPLSPRKRAHGRTLLVSTDLQLGMNLIVSAIRLDEDGNRLVELRDDDGLTCIIEFP